MAGAHSKRGHVRAKRVHALTVQMSTARVPGYSMMHAPMGCVRGYLMHVPVQCARRRVHMLRVPWSLYVHPVASFKCPGCRCIKQENQEGCCHGEYIRPSTMSAGEAF